MGFKGLLRDVHQNVNLLFLCGSIKCIFLLLKKKKINILNGTCSFSKIKKKKIIRWLLSAWNALPLPHCLGLGNLFSPSQWVLQRPPYWLSQMGPRSLRLCSLAFSHNTYLLKGYIIIFMAIVCSLPPKRVLESNNQWFLFCLHAYFQPFTTALGTLAGARHFRRMTSGEISLFLAGVYLPYHHLCRCRALGEPPFPSLGTGKPGPCNSHSGEPSPDLGSRHVTGSPVPRVWQARRTILPRILESSHGLHFPEVLAPPPHPHPPHPRTCVRDGAFAARVSGF